MPKRVDILVRSEQDAAVAERARATLRTKFGHYSVRPLWDTDDVADGHLVLQASDLPHDDDDFDNYVAEFVTDNLQIGTADLTSRDDHELLTNYVTPNGELDILRDPRDWINSNPLMKNLMATDKRYANMVDFVVEQRGLVLKPAQYATQKNYWNSPTNAGLPIVRKKDTVHEGTFMLHDLFHFAIEDPLPIALNGMSRSESARLFLIHRMASESTTLVLADMLAIGDADLESVDYDVGKRGIYPVYKDILMAGNAKIEDLIRANIEFCFSGNVDGFRALGAGEDALKKFKEKYEVFFSADFDWNLANFNFVNDQIELNPDTMAYYEEAAREFGIQTIDKMYDSSGGLSVDDVADKFIAQIKQGFLYESHGNDIARAIEAARRYYGGQLKLFYDYPNQRLKGDFIDAFKQVEVAKSWTELQEKLKVVQEIVSSWIDHLESQGAINGHDRVLFKMHYPLYPANFLHYDADAARYRDLPGKLNRLVTGQVQTH